MYLVLEKALEKPQQAGEKIPFTAVGGCGGLGWRWYHCPAAEVLVCNEVNLEMW